MSNISINSNHPITDGMKFSFRTPCNCTEVDGLIIKYRDDENNEVSKTFIFADTHGKNISGLGNLFEVGVMVEVILDVTNGKAFLVNSATNSYLEDKTNIPDSSYEVIGLNFSEMYENGEIQYEAIPNDIGNNPTNYGELSIPPHSVTTFGALGQIEFETAYILSDDNGTTIELSVVVDGVELTPEVVGIDSAINASIHKYFYSGEVKTGIVISYKPNLFSTTLLKFTTFKTFRFKGGLMTSEDKQLLYTLGNTVASKGVTFDWKDVNKVIPLEPGCIYDLKGDKESFNWYLDEACTNPIYDNDGNLLLAFKEAILFTSSNDRGDGLSQHHVLIFSKQTVKGYSETGEEKDVQTKTFTTKMFTTPYGSNFYIKSSNGGTISLWKAKM